MALPPMIWDKDGIQLQVLEFLEPLAIDYRAKRDFLRMKIMLLSSKIIQANQ